MKILTIGDIVSKQGCEYLRSTLPSLKRELGADIVIANGENSAVGNGILPQSAEFILDCGVDLITLGNHSLKRREIYEEPSAGETGVFGNICHEGRGNEPGVCD